MIDTLASALAARGYDSLTPVQQAVTDPALDGQDLLVSAQTGSGKTVGFGLAIGPTILDETGQFGPADRPLALVIAPTRELAMQVKRELGWLYAGAGAVIASTVGGMDMRDERRSLERGAHIVVATPGRLKDHILRGSLDMSDMRAIVLDEADEMLDLGFREDLEFILGKAPETRRTLMFSATVPPMIVKLAQSYQKDAVRVATVSKDRQHSDIEYRALPVAAHDADNAIINVLRYYEAPNAIVFANTRAMVTRLTTRLSNRGFAVVALSGELSQTERTHALQAMRDGRARVCVATDVAARGIDLPNLDLVIHAELPTNAEILLHRSGRTGRAGRKGISVMIVPPKMRRRAENLLTWGKLNATWAAPPSAEEVQTRDEERLLTDPVWSETFTDAEQAFASRLLAQHAPEKIAAAYLRLYAGRQSAPEDLSEVSVAAPRAGERPAREPREPRERKAAFGPSRWFRIDLGRDQKAEARWLLPMLCKAGDITKTEIGAIRIQPGETFVEISEPAVPGFLAAIGPAMQLENQARLSAVDGVPQISERGARPARRPRDTTFDAPPPPSTQDDLAPIAPVAPATPIAPVASATPITPVASATPIPGAADDRPPRKPRAAKPAYGADKGRPPKPRPAWEDRGDERAPRARPARDTGDKPAWTGKRDSNQADAPRPGKGPGGKPAWKDKPAARAQGAGTDGAPKGKAGPGGKPAWKGKSAPRDGAADGAKGGKPAWAGKPAREGGKSFAKPGGKPARADSAGPGAGAGKPRPNAADTSRRFTPPGQKGGKGGAATPRRTGPKSR